MALSYWRFEERMKQTMGRLNWMVNKLEQKTEQEIKVTDEFKFHLIRRRHEIISLNTVVKYYKERPFILLCINIQQYLHKSEACFIRVYRSLISSKFDSHIHTHIRRKLSNSFILRTFPVKSIVSVVWAGGCVCEMFCRRNWNYNTWNFCKKDKDWSINAFSWPIGLFRPNACDYRSVYIILSESTCYLPQEEGFLLRWHYNVMNRGLSVLNILRWCHC